MSKTEILAQLPLLTPAERQEIRLELTKLDGEAWRGAGALLTEVEKAILDARLAAYERDPEAGASWDEVEAKLSGRLSK